MELPAEKWALPPAVSAMYVWCAFGIAGLRLALPKAGVGEAVSLLGLCPELVVYHFTSKGVSVKVQFHIDDK